MFPKLTVDLRDREPLFSYACRLAARHGLNVVDFARDKGTSFQAIINGTSVAAEIIARVGGVECEKIIEWTPVYTDPRTYTFRGEKFHARGLLDTTIRGCPVCLRADAQTSDFNSSAAMAIRGDWLFKYVTHCADHDHLIVPLWKNLVPYERFDTASRLGEIAHEIMAGSLDQPSCTATDFDTYLQNRLEGKRTKIWLDNQSLYAACVFSDLFGRAVQDARTIKVESRDAKDLSQRCQAGFNAAKHGPKTIRPALMNIQRRIGRPGYGNKIKLGGLYDRLQYDLPSDDYSPFRDILRQHVVETWPLGPGDEILGKTITTRKWHSVQTASRETGVDSRLMRKLLVNAGLITTDGDDDTWELFDAKSAAPFLDNLKYYGTAFKLKQALNISHSQMNLLRQDGFLEPAIEADGVKSNWDVRAGQELIAELLIRSVPVSARSEDVEFIAKVSQRLKIRPGQILKTILSNKLKFIGKMEGIEGYEALLVSIDEVRKLFVPPPAIGMSIEAFAAHVGMKPRQTGRFVKDGHTPSTVGLNPIKRVNQSYITTSDLSTFYSFFATVRLLTELLSMPKQTVAAELRRRAIKPYSPNGVDYGSVFCWTDIEEKWFCRWATADAHE